MPRKKVNLAKEAKTQAKETKIEDEITAAVLREFCPKGLRKNLTEARSKGGKADLLHMVNQMRLEKQREAEELKKFCTKLEKWFIQELPDDDATGVSGKVAHIQIKKKSRPSVADWDKLYAHIKRKGEFELLNRAPNARAIKERWEQGKEVPGVEEYKYSGVSITKVK